MLAFMEGNPNTIAAAAVGLVAGSAVGALLKVGIRSVTKAAIVPATTSRNAIRLRASARRRIHQENPVVADCCREYGRNCTSDLHKLGFSSRIELL